MTTRRSDDGRPAAGGLSRRELVVAGGAALAAGVALPPGSEAATPRRRLRSRLPLERPNFVILVTDQERYPQHWPDGWVEEHLPNRVRLAAHGLTFTHAFCNTAMCSPSRATLFTGLYPAEHGVKEVLQVGAETNGTEYHLTQATLQPDTWNMARMLADAGYDVQYRGKWHLSKDPSGTVAAQSRRDLEHYGFQGWLPPDAAEHYPSCFGGAEVDNDGLYAAQAAEFLAQADPHAQRPFALFICLVNPHDIMGYPKYTSQPSYSDIAPYEGKHYYEQVKPQCFELGIELPPTFDEPKTGNFKPRAQAESTAFWSLAASLGPLEELDGPLKYVNFYAFLHKESDRHIGTILDALEANPGLFDHTIVFRLADHGEMGLSHGGMRQKAYNAYEETIHVPLVIANPRLFRAPVETAAFASLIDVMPTLATLAGVSSEELERLKGRDLTPIIRDAAEHPDHPTGSVQDSILFTTDETIGSREGARIVRQPAHIRCLRDSRWKLVMYFDPADPANRDYELYDLASDPIEYNNMANPGSPFYNPVKLAQMLAQLESRMAETATTPP